MTKIGSNLWPKTFVIEWIQIHDDTKFVTDWRHIYDKKTNFVTDEQMWRHHSDQTKIVIKTSQKTNCDHSGVFNDDNATSLMTTSLLVNLAGYPSLKPKYHLLWLPPWPQPIVENGSSIQGRSQDGANIEDFKYLSKGKVFLVPTLSLSPLCPRTSKRLRMGEEVGTMQF
jgi:hypothetical protein